MTDIEIIQFEKELREEIAKALWTAFEYGLPVSPVTMANFVITQIKVAGYEIVKVGE